MLETRPGRDLEGAGCERRGPGTTLAPGTAGCERRWRRSGVALGLLLLSASSAPALPEASSRTLAVAIEVDRDQARLLAFAAKDRLFAAHAESEERGLAPPGPGLEVALHGAGGFVHVAHLRLDGLCLDHGPDAPAHVEGDRIRLHRDTFVVEVPESAGADTLDFAFSAGAGATAARRQTAGRAVLDAAHFAAGASDSPFSSLAFASASASRPGPAEEPPSLAGTPAVIWPEELGDSDRIRVYGDVSESAQRINVVIVPDGYTHAQKALLETHAAALVAAFRGRTPYKEHDRFINYTLVYAYSVESGTDRCDCGVVADTAMGTRFPAAGGACGSAENRCLYYGTANGGPDCDANTSAANIAAAELRAPVHDTTIVMVNTSRYGGCGGSRAVYSAASGSATEIAIHELGHSLVGLYDEYDGDPGCGSDNGPNVSTDRGGGGWPEWVGELGAPRQGASTYDSCVFRPSANCGMRELGQPFCKVCAQRFALTFFGHFRVRPTAPIASQSPASVATAAVGSQVSFSLSTRLATGSLVVNRVTWRHLPPGVASPVPVGSGSPSLDLTLDVPGVHTITCELAAGTNFVRTPGANVDTATWTVTVGSGSGCGTPVAFGGIRRIADLDLCARSGIAIEWDAAGFGAAGGTYEVTRDGLPLASGLATLVYTDHPGDDEVHEYRVSAVSPGCGPVGGTVPAAPGRDLSAAATLPPVGNVLRAAKAGADVLVRWTDTGEATSYLVGAADGPSAPGYMVIGTAETGSSGMLDRAAAAAGLRRYRVQQERCAVRSPF